MNYLLLIALILSTIPIESVAQQWKKADSFVGEEGEVRAFGDYNSDKFTDIIVATTAEAVENVVKVYIWNNDAREFSFFKVTGNIDDLVSIEGVVGGDFNHDGRMDIMISGTPADNAAPDNDVLNLFYIQQKDGELVKSSEVVASKGQVLVMDFNGNFCVDLFGVSAASNRVYWKNKACNGENEFGFEPPIALKTPADMASPHSNSFFDVNGDCLPDLIVTGQTDLQVYINDGSKNTFIRESSKNYTLPARGMGQISVADFDQNGSPDIMFPVCDDIEGVCNEMHVYLNEFDENSGSKATKLCEASGKYLDFGRMDGSDDGNKKHVIIKLPNNMVFTKPTDRNKYKKGTKQEDQETSTGLIRVRVGDLNTDGFPDLLVPVTEDGINKIILWMNEPKSKGQNEAQHDLASRFGVDSIVKINELDGASAATFFDMGENGVFDIIANKDGGILVLENGAQPDSYFLKTIGLNGVCPAYCNGEDKFPEPKPYGVNHPGVSFKFVVTTLDNKAQIREGVQLPQSAYDPLGAPYVLFGLGRTSNYVEFFFVGLFVSGSMHYNSWPAIIPNSQLIMFPYERESPETWILELFISTPQSLLWVGISCLCTLLAIAVVILFFHHREQREDEAEKRKNEHFFTF